MDLAHAKVVNDGGPVDEMVDVKMDIERHIARGSVAYWSVLPTKGRLEGEKCQGVLNELGGRKPFIPKREEWYKIVREKPWRNGDVGRVQEVDY